MSTLFTVLITIWAVIATISFATLEVVDEQYKSIKYRILMFFGVIAWPFTFLGILIYNYRKKQPND